MNPKVPIYKRFNICPICYRTPERCKCGKYGIINILSAGIYISETEMSKKEFENKFNYSVGSKSSILKKSKENVYIIDHNKKYNNQYKKHDYIYYIYNKKKDVVLEVEIAVSTIACVARKPVNGMIYEVPIITPLEKKIDEAKIIHNIITDIYL